jgi:diaminohydroxyphosphoribosylaminopyrimidine deaminase/5-amino-6-(5-phosphoribosylamino)uracil reductase
MPFKSKKTPSCAHALVAAGVRRVVFPVVDPNPHVAGRGANFLRRSGVQVTCDKSAASQSIALNRGFFSRMQRHRPWVILKTALSLDGKAATATGQSRWITGQAARAAVHRMRAECDAILVGAGTILSDNPALTSHGNGPNPLRVIFAGRRKLPSNSRVFDAAAETVVYTIKKEKDMLAALRDLSQAGVGTLLVEGGPTLHSVLLRAGLVDEARVFIAPKFISGTDNPNRAPTIDSPNVSRLGSDWLIEGTL